MCRWALVIALAALAALAQGEVDQANFEMPSPTLQPREGEFVFQGIAGPYDVQARDVARHDMQKFARPARRPDGDVLVTGYVQHVYRKKADVVRVTSVDDLVEVTFDPQVDGFYFHHSTMHRENAALGHVWESPSIHNANFLFPQSPEIIGEVIQFESGYGYRANDDVEPWALCAHIKWTHPFSMRVFIFYEFTYRPYVPGDREVTVERFGNDLQPTDVPPREIGGVHRCRFLGKIAQGHGPAVITHVMWHLHLGVRNASLVILRGPFANSEHELSPDLAQASASAVERYTEVTFEGTATNTIEHFSVIYEHPQVQEGDILMVDAYVNLSTVYRVLDATQEWFMIFNILGLSYEDGFNGHRTPLGMIPERTQSGFGTFPFWD